MYAAEESQVKDERRYTIKVFNHLALLTAYYDVIRFSLYHMTRHNQLEVSIHLRKKYVSIANCDI